MNKLSHTTVSLLLPYFMVMPGILGGKYIFTGQCLNCQGGNVQSDFLINSNIWQMLKVVYSI